MKFMNADTAAAFLEQIGWPGSLPEATRLLAELESLTPDLAVDLDVGGRGPLPPLGIEFRLEPERAAAAIDWLEGQGLCRPERADGLRAFPGRSRVFDLRMLLEVEREIGHFKITLRDGGRRAKAYLCLRATPDVAADRMQETGPAALRGAG